MSFLKNPFYWITIILGGIVNYIVPEYFLTNYLIGLIVGITVAFIDED